LKPWYCMLYPPQIKLESDKSNAYPCAAPIGKALVHTVLLAELRH
jgi:hypothetical protein